MKLNDFIRYSRAFEEGIEVTIGGRRSGLNYDAISGMAAQRVGNIYRSNALLAQMSGQAHAVVSSSSSLPEMDVLGGIFGNIIGK